MNEHGPELVGPTLVLRPATREELRTIQEWFERPEVARIFNLEEPMLDETESGAIGIRFEHIASRLQTANLMEGSRSLVPGTYGKTRLEYLRSAKPAELAFAIRRGTTFLGAIMLRVSIVHLIGTIRTIIDPGYRGRGIGTETKRLVLRYCFETLSLRKVVSNTLESNVANYRCNLACGFKVEGILRSHAAINGTRGNLLCMGILREEYLALDKSHWHF